MTKQEIKALRRPFLKALFRQNKFNLFMTLIASALNAAMALLISWVIKEIPDLIAGDSPYSFQTIWIAALCGLGMGLLAGLLDMRFLSEFRAKAMRQYREYAFDQLLKKGIQAFSGENSALYLSALSNDGNTIERDFVANLQSAVQITLTFFGALALMLWYSPLLTAIAIGLSLLPLAASIVLGNKSAKAEKEVSDQKESYTGMQKDVLTGFAEVKSAKAVATRTGKRSARSERAMNRRGSRKAEPEGTGACEEDQAKKSAGWMPGH